MNRIHHEARLHRHKASQAAVTALEFLADQAIRDAVHARTVVSVERAAEQPKLGDFPYEVGGKLVIFERLLHKRDDAVIDETADSIFDHGLVFAELGTNVVKIEWIECLETHRISPENANGA